MNRAKLLLIAVTLSLNMVGCKSEVQKKNVILESELIHPVTKYEVIELPNNVTVSKFEGNVFFAVENEGFIKVNEGDEITKESTLIIESDAYLLLNCKKVKCVEFNPAPEARWLKFDIKN